MKGCAEFTFEVEEPGWIYRALNPELEDELARSNVDIAPGDGSIKLRIEGNDIASLRAALNTWIRLVKIAIEMVNI
jgi:KEOPS complex subunit Pcc1